MFLQVAYYRELLDPRKRRGDGQLCIEGGVMRPMLAAAPALAVLDVDHDVNELNDSEESIPEPESDACSDGLDCDNDSNATPTGTGPGPDEMLEGGVIVGGGGAWQLELLTELPPDGPPVAEAPPPLPPPLLPPPQDPPAPPPAPPAPAPPIAALGMGGMGGVGPVGFLDGVAARNNLRKGADNTMRWYPGDGPHSFLMTYVPNVPGRRI